jgi:hypothetical protein
VTTYRVGDFVGSSPEQVHQRTLSKALIHWRRRREVTDETTAEFLSNFMEEYRGFITLVYTALPRGG